MVVPPDRLQALHAAFIEAFPDYAALERASGVRNNDPRSDLFFVGVILYNMLAGVSPIGDNGSVSSCA